MEKRIYFILGFLLVLVHYFTNVGGSFLYVCHSSLVVSKVKDRKW